MIAGLYRETPTLRSICYPPALHLSKRLGGYWCAYGHKRPRIAFPMMHALNEVGSEPALVLPGWDSTLPVRPHLTSSTVSSAMDSYFIA